MRCQVIVDLETTALTLRDELDALRFAAPVAFTYNPLTYAWQPHAKYLRRFGQKTERTVLLGMNPGPWGMAQTGIPFGEVSFAKNWLGLEAPVGKPENEHPKKVVEGFRCSRSEVSGARLWGWAKERYGTADHFFEDFFVINYCPLLFLENGGKNRTPDKLSREEVRAVQEVCDRALQRSVAALQPKRIIGIGVYAEKRAQTALSSANLPIGRILHPSPASPIANKGWAARAEAELAAQGVSLPRS